MFPNLYRLLLVNLLDITDKEAQELGLGSPEFYHLAENAQTWILQQSIGDPLRSEVTDVEDNEAALVGVIVLAMRMGEGWSWRDVLAARREAQAARLQKEMDEFEYVDECPF